MTATVACGSCGNAVRETAKFCDECGAAIATPGDPARYKHVTVLFADVVRSMAIAATLDMERLRDVMTDLVERSTAVVHRYGGGIVEYTGDGIMALFGAPVALEDHAFRGCLAALAIQDEARRLATEMAIRDGVELRVRVGLNSGRVIAGEMGSGSSRYTATGDTVGFAQRMESAAPPGGVLLSESTAQLVERTVELAEPEWVRIKGSDMPVPARRLLAIGSRDAEYGRVEAALVGRRWEMAALNALVGRTIDGRGGVVNVVGPPGIGKSRVAREGAATARGRGIEVVWTYCESHARDVPLYAVSRLLRASMGVDGLDGEAARARVRAAVPTDADPHDVLLLNELLGIADPQSASPQIDPDARRRRLTALLSSIALARTEPALFVIEDAHWIDAVSESILADLLAVIAHTPLMVLVTARPEYEGALARAQDAQSIALVALEDSDTAELLGELLGDDPSVVALTAIIVERAVGNPFFAEEMVRELVQRGVLAGERGGYVCDADVADLSVPATVQAAIEARIDRLDAASRRTLDAASVIGVRFHADLLGTLGVDVVIDELLGAELIERVSYSPGAEYAFRHPLIRAVAYESQLKSDRAQWHRRLSVALQERGPTAVDESAAMIAEHLEAAGDAHAAYAWHMRAGGWSANRDGEAARISWERASRIADALPIQDPQRLAMRIAPRTMLCATDWQARILNESRGRFAELQEMCTAADDKVSLAIGMSGLATELLFSARPEGARLASEQMVLLDSIGDPNLTVGLAFVAFTNWFSVGDFGEILRWSQTAIDLAAGDATTGAGFGMGAPLAVSLTFRGISRLWLGVAGWRQDFLDAVAMARKSDPATFAVVVTWTYGLAIVCGVLPANDEAIDTIEEALKNARRASSDIAVIFAEYTLGGALLHRDDPTDRQRGMQIMLDALEWQRKRMPTLVPATELLIGREKSRRGEHSGAIADMREAVDALYAAQRLGYAVFGTDVLVEALVKRGTAADLAEAQRALDRLRDLRPEQHLTVRDITLLRLRALLARAVGDAVAYRDLANHYLDMAKSLQLDVHLAWAEELAGAI